jgi:methanogenic corrinoid protein MtbC1
LGRGYRPGEILQLSTRELDKLLSFVEPSAQAPAGRERLVEPAGEGVQRSVAVMLHAAMDLDRETLVRELRANWIRMGPLAFLQDLAGPFMIAVGTAWHERRLDIRHEHFASACLTGFLREVRESYDHAAKGPRVTAAMLSGDRHEGGLLMASALVAIRGCRLLYLGSDTPVDQIAAAASGGHADAVAISISAATPRARASKALAELRIALPNRMPLWVGGSGAPTPPKGVQRFESLAAFAAMLSTWAWDSPLPMPQRTR